MYRERLAQRREFYEDHWKSHCHRRLNVQNLVNHAQSGQEYRS